MIFVIFALGLFGVNSRPQYGGYNPFPHYPNGGTFQYPTGNLQMGIPHHMQQPYFPFSNMNPSPEYAYAMPQNQPIMVNYLFLYKLNLNFFSL